MKRKINPNKKPKYKIGDILNAKNPFPRFGQGSLRDLIIIKKINKIFKYKKIDFVYEIYRFSKNETNLYKEIDLDVFYNKL